MRLTAALVGLTLAAPPAGAVDPTTQEQFGKWAASITAQNPSLRFDARAQLTSPSRDGYQRLFAERQDYPTMQNHPSIGGVLFGRPPEPGANGGPPEPLALPGFTYELLPAVKGKPRRVRLHFAKAGGEKLDPVEVSAAVVTPMTAAALDGRLGLFTALADGTAAVHPAIDGHQLAYRPAVVDGFAFTRRRLTPETREALARLGENHAAVLVERPWPLSEASLRLPEDDDAASALVEFAVRPASETSVEFKPYPVAKLLSKEVFKSMTAPERQMFAELQEALLVGRVVLAVVRGWVTEFDRAQNWSKLIDELGPTYKANLSGKADALRLNLEMRAWDARYQGGKPDKVLPERMRLK